MADERVRELERAVALDPTDVAAREALYSARDRTGNLEMSDVEWHLARTGGPGRVTGGATPLERITLTLKAANRQSYVGSLDPEDVLALASSAVSRSGAQHVSGDTGKWSWANSRNEATAYRLGPAIVIKVHRYTQVPRRPRRRQEPARLARHAWTLVAASDLVPLAEQLSGRPTR